jgi:hypothetical protein
VCVADAGVPPVIRATGAMAGPRMPRRPRRRWAACQALALAFACVAGPAALAGSQLVTPRVAAVSGQHVAVDVGYATEPAGASLPGLAIRIHFDSRALAFESFADVVERGLIASAGTPSPDATDADGDPRTDVFVAILWADVQGNWPGPGVGRLATLHFRPLAAAVATSVAVSAIESSPGWSMPVRTVVVDSARPP